MVSEQCDLSSLCEVGNQLTFSQPSGLSYLLHLYSLSGILAGCLRSTRSMLTDYAKAPIKSTLCNQELGYI